MGPLARPIRGQALDHRPVFQVHARREVLLFVHIIFQGVSLKFAASVRAGSKYKLLEMVGGSLARKSTSYALRGIFCDALLHEDTPAFMAAMKTLKPLEPPYRTVRTSKFSPPGTP